MTRPLDLASDLRAFVDWYGCDPGVPMSAVDIAVEAAGAGTDMIGGIVMVMVALLWAWQLNNRKENNRP